MSRLMLYLLGPPRIEYEGTPIEVDRRKAIALIIYLAMTEESHSRDRLATLFWPNYDQSRARSALRSALWALNRTPAGNWLDVSQETLGLHHDANLWVDVAHFRHLLETCRAHNHPPDEVCPTCLPPLTEAVALYRDNFMAGFTLPDSPAFDEWQVFQSESLRQELASALERLIRSFSAQEEYKSAISYARRWLGLEPWREEAHQHLMRLFARNGQRSAALAQYESCRRFLAEELAVEPAAETVALYEQIRAGELSKGETPSVSPAPSLPRSPAQDWGEAPEIAVFYGRQAELAELEQWLVTDRCRVVAVLGMGGLGKTALAAKLPQGLVDQFDYIIWRSLLNAPPLAEILRACLQFLSAQQVTDLPDSLDERLTLLLDPLRRHRCLIVLDNVEGILQGGDRAGYYRPGYEAYGQLIQRLGEARHQSCLLLTSREKPSEFTRLERDTTLVRSLQLVGLEADAGQEILRARGLSGSAETRAALVERYSGNPLALRLVAETIHELFEGDIAAFLTEKTPIFDDIRDVLDQQFARMSALEREIMIWLAIEREAISAPALGDNLAPRGRESQRAYLEALRSLQRRSLVEKSGDGFTLQNVVIEYTTDRLIEQVCQELEAYGSSKELKETQGAEVPLSSSEFLPVPTSSPEVSSLYINHYSLMKAQAKEYIRQSQARLILQPIAERLVARLGQAGVETKLKHLLTNLRTEGPLTPGYAGANILNLLLHLGSDVRGYNFSRLTVWQAYLRGVTLPEVNFSGADLTQSVFTDTFGFVNSVAFSPNGQLLAAGTDDGEIRLWQVATGQPAGICQGHANFVRSAVFSPDGRILASGSADQTVRLWDAHTGQCLNTLHGHTNGTSVAFSPDGRILASGSNDQTVRLWDVHTGQCLNTLHGHTDWVRSVAFSPDGHLLASGSADQIVRLWDAHSGPCLNTLHGHTDWVRSVAFSPTGGTLASGSADQTVRLWDAHTGQCLNTLHRHTHWVHSVAFSPDGHILASGSADQTVRLWDVHTGQCLDTLHGYTNWANSVAFSPDGEILASGSEDQTVRLWDVHTGQCLDTLHGHTSAVYSVAFSPDPETLASGGLDQTVRLWDARTGQCLNTLYGHTNEVTSIAFSPDGRIVASGSNDQTVRLWDAHTGQCLNTLHRHTSAVYSVAISPDGNILASGSADQTVRLWDVHTGQCLNTLHRHTSAVYSVTFSLDGRILASGSFDRTVRLWDTRTGQCLNILHGHTHWVNSVAFSPDGKTLASSSADETIKLWGVQTGECLRTLRIDKPYARMNITEVTGLTETQRAALKVMGAVEDVG